MLSSALNFSGVSADQTLLTDTLNVWLQRAIQLQDLHHSKSVLTDSNATDLFLYVCDFWTDSGVALGSALRELFVKLITLLSKARNGTELESLFADWIRRILTFSRSMRIFYFTLETLIQHVDGAQFLQAHSDIVPDAFAKMSSNALANPASKMLFALLKSSKQHSTSEADWLKFWSKATVDSLFLSDAVREAVVTFYLPLVLFKFPQFLNSIVDSIKSSNGQCNQQLIGVIRVAQEIGIFDIAQSQVVSLSDIEMLLKSSDPSLRLGAFSILVSSPQGSKPIPQPVLDLLARNWDVLFEADAGYRNQINGLMRNFVSRIRGYAYAKNRELAKMASARAKTNDLQTTSEIANEETQCTEILGSLSDFLRSLLDCLQLCLRPGSPYYRLVTGVTILTILIRSGLDHSVDDQYLLKKQFLKFPFSVDIFTPLMCRLLIDNVANNYDDIRSGCCSILQMAPTHVIEQPAKSLLDKALLMIRRARGREGDAGAHMVKFIFTYKENLSFVDGVELISEVVSQLEQQTLLASEDYASSAESDNIHGTFTSLSYIFECIKLKSLDPAEEMLLADLVLRIVTCCVSIWKVVEPILTQDAPEGSIIEESLDSQTTMSYAWRAIRESTALQKVLFDRIDSTEIVPNELVVRCGEIILNQLATVRHRGAFSSVYPTFISCCLRCYNREELVTLPDVWLENNLELVQNRSQYVTRRSGGIPYLITAVLSANILNDPSDNSKLAQKTFENLLAVAQTPVIENESMDYPQVHAFNCIKAILIDSRLSAHCGFMIDSALELAISSFSSTIWSIRNCAVMLFTALQNRLFGTKRAISAKLFFSRHKTVRSLLLSNLASSVSQISETSGPGRETLFPSLTVLSRLQPVSDYSGLDDFKHLVIKCLSCKEWKIREMAARALAHITHASEIDGICAKLLQDASLNNQNDLHGRLLAILEMRTSLATKEEAERFDAALNRGTGQGKDFVQTLASHYCNLLLQNDCFPTTLLYFRIIKTFPDSEAVKEYCKFAIDSLCTPRLDACVRRIRAEAAEYLLQWRCSTPLLLQLLQDKAYEVQLAVIAFIDTHLDSIDFDKQEFSNLLWHLTTTETLLLWDQVKGPMMRLLCRLDSLHKFEQPKLIDLWHSLYNICQGNGGSEELREAALESLGMVSGLVSDQKLDELYSDVILHQASESATARKSSLDGLSCYLLAKGSKACASSVLCLYYFLSDDDAEIRTQAMQTASKYLDVSPMAIKYCEELLLDHLGQLPASKTLILDALIGPTSIQDQVSLSLQDNEDLFLAEKENLYRDELVQLDQFSDFLHEAGIDIAVSGIAKEASDFLINLLADKKVDGALGWSSSPEAFFALYKVKKLLDLAQTAENDLNLDALKEEEAKVSYHEELCI